MKRIRIDLLSRASGSKTAGYFMECLQAGQMDGDYLLIPEPAYKQLQRRHRGLGDRVHDVLAPLAKWLDRRLGTRFMTCQACARRRARLNGISGWFRGIKKRR